jgi:hypothetical protein
MKKLLALLLIILIGIGCKKESTDGKEGNTYCNLPEMKGTWIGKWGDLFDDQENNFQFELKENNVAIINNGSATYEGEWHLEEFTFIATYTISGEVLKVKAPISGTRLEGIWKNETSNLYKGTFYINKQ